LTFVNSDLFFVGVRRIESVMHPLVRSAVHSSIAVVRAVRKMGTGTSDASIPFASASPRTKNPTLCPYLLPRNPNPLGPNSAPVSTGRHVSRPKEFARTSTAAPRRLNDIAQAPPELSSFARRPSSSLTLTRPGKAAPKSTKASSVLSPAEQLQMATTHEAAVAHYRELKAVRRAAGAGAGADGGERGGRVVGEGEEWGCGLGVVWMRVALVRATAAFGVALMLRRSPRAAYASYVAKTRPSLPAPAGWRSDTRVIRLCNTAWIL